MSARQSGHTIHFLGGMLVWFLNTVNVSWFSAAGGEKETISITDVLSKPEAVSRKRRRTKDEPEVSLKQEMNAMKPEDLGAYDVCNGLVFLIS